MIFWVENGHNTQVEFAYCRVVKLALKLKELVNVNIFERKLSDVVVEGGKSFEQLLRGFFSFDVTLTQH